MKLNEIHEKLFDVVMNHTIPEFKKGLRVELEKHLTAHSGKVPNYVAPLETFYKWFGKGYKGELPLWKSHMGHLHAYYFWQFARAELLIDFDLGSHIMHGEPPKKTPVEILKRLPYWSQWIRTHYAIEYEHKDPSRSITLDFLGCFASYVNIENTTYLNLTAPVYSSSGSKTFDSLEVAFVIQIPLDHDRDIDADGTFITTVIGIPDDQEESEREATQLIALKFSKQALNLILFICSQEQNLISRGAVQPSVKRKGKNYKIQATQKSKTFHVGQEFAEAIKEYETKASESKPTARKAHLRRAHFNHYWTGPRSGTQKLISIWIPPQVISGKE